NRKHPSTLVPAAGAACESSRPSCVGNNQRIDRRHGSRRSESTHHEASARARNTQIHSLSVLAFSRQRDQSCPRVNFTARNNANAFDKSRSEPCCAFAAPIRLA